ncbi:MAG: lipoyl synthase [Candidatus Thermoplasmatota archaeon]|nr:lipoyl synthase [Candidatus Thermoplasmatota archaeon]
MVRPDYLRVPLPSGEAYSRIKSTLRVRTLHTVCEEARCPNVAECWGAGTATFMVMGGNCSRGCRFCSVTHGGMTPLDPDEPRKVAESVGIMGLDYVVITSVDRDDLEDQGAGHFADVIRTVKRLNVKVEVLIPDFRGDMELVNRVIEGKPDVVAHNIETVRRLTPVVRDGRAGYDQSLGVLSGIRRDHPGIITKSSIMVGFGETDSEVEETLGDLRRCGVDIVTIGQYLRPSRKQIEVFEYCSAERFQRLEKVAYSLGFSFVASGPLVRTSYRAAEAWSKRRIENV